MTGRAIEGYHTTLEHAVGAKSVRLDTSQLAIDGTTPQVAISPSSIEELSRAVTALSQLGLAASPWGGGTRICLGNPLQRYEVAILMGRLGGLVQHTPADLTATVEAGMTVAALQEALGRHGQFLALDPPLPDRATVGGTLAVGTSGPLKWQYGSLRDLVIGMTVVQGDGKRTKSGGQVVKNVSGYDMAKLHIGGLGTLGVIAQVSFRLTPLPSREATLLARFDEADEALGAAMAVSHSGVVPLALTALNGATARRSLLPVPASGWTLAIRTGGRPLAVQRQVDDCTSLCRQGGARSIETLDEGMARRLWRTLADFGWDAETTPLASARISLVPSRVKDAVHAIGRQGANGSKGQAVVCHPAHGTVLVHWYEAPADPEAHTPRLGQLRDAVRKLGGFTTFERLPTEVKSRMDVWDDVDESLALMKRTKQQYDPNRVLNPGRFVGGI